MLLFWWSSDRVGSEVGWQPVLRASVIVNVVLMFPWQPCMYGGSTAVDSLEDVSGVSLRASMLPHRSAQTNRWPR